MRASWGHPKMTSRATTTECAHIAIYVHISTHMVLHHHMGVLGRVLLEGTRREGRTSPPWVLEDHPQGTLQMTPYGVIMRVLESPGCAQIAYNTLNVHIMHNVHNHR